MKKKECLGCNRFLPINENHFRMVEREGKYYFLNRCYKCEKIRRKQLKIEHIHLEIHAKKIPILGHRNEPYFNNEDEMIYIPPTFEELSIIEQRIYKRLK